MLPPSRHRLSGGIRQAAPAERYNAGKKASHILITKLGQTSPSLVRYAGEDNLHLQVREDDKKLAPPLQISVPRSGLSDGRISETNINCEQGVNAQHATNKRAKSGTQTTYREDLRESSDTPFSEKKLSCYILYEGTTSRGPGPASASAGGPPSDRGLTYQPPISHRTAIIESETRQRRAAFSEMPRASSPWDKKSEDGVARRPTSKRSSMSRTSYGEDSLRTDGQDEDKGSTMDPSENSDPRRSSVSKNARLDAFQDGTGSLPAEKGFPIQIGSELFRLSGASIMSDAPSYFSKCFQDQLQTHEDGSGGVRTLYIDRDPTTFQDIARHLQGYHIQPRDGEHYVRLFADAQFYSLPKLIKQLFDSEIFMQIGDQNFQIPREIFSSPGDSPNFFSLGFAVFFNSPDEVFPGLEREGLLRPPSILPPSVQGRSAGTFSDLLHLLRGYPLHIRNKEHRAELLRDCRYFHLRGLEQKLIVHQISYNVQREKSEILIRLEDLRQSGVSFAGDVTPADRSSLAGWVHYARPFADETTHELIVEVGEESTRIDFRSMRADFFGSSKARITSLFQVVANKMNLPTEAPLGLMMASGGVSAQPVSPGNTPLSEDRVKVLIEQDTHIVLDGEEYSMEQRGFDAMDNYGNNSEALGETAGYTQPSWGSIDQTGMLPPSRSPSVKPPPRKRKRRGSLDEFGEWMIRKGQWRLRVQPRSEQVDHFGQRMEIVLHAVKLDAVSGQRGRNTLRGFLT